MELAPTHWHLISASLVFVFGLWVSFVISGTFETRKQNPPQAIAHGGAETAFKRFGRKFPVGGGQRRRVAIHHAGQFEPTPSYVHR